MVGVRKGLTQGVAIVQFVCSKKKGERHSDRTFKKNYIMPLCLLHCHSLAHDNVTLSAIKSIF